MIFIDTSALIAILAEESDASTLAAKIESERERISGAHVILEASMRFATLCGLAPTAADAEVTRALHAASVAIVPITEEVAHIAVAAFERYGKGRKNRAGLNFGDCMSYRCARAYGAGGDFAHNSPEPEGRANAR